VKAERFMICILSIKPNRLHILKGSKRAAEKELRLQSILIAYGDTAHPATGVTPNDGMHGRPIRTRLDHETTQKPFKKRKIARKLTSGRKSTRNE
jgi:hypothetical protein